MDKKGKHEMFDTVIKNGLIADGSGEAPYRAALYIKNGIIEKIDENDALPAEAEIDAGGNIVCPGFIDMHTHSDSVPWTAPGFEGRLHQGVTTDIAGNCGSSVIPKKEQANPLIHCLTMREMKDELKNMSFGANYNTFIGHGTLRNLCLKDPYVPVPSGEEIEAMKDALRREMEAGAVGMSLGLEYMPGMCCETEELIALAKVVAEFDGLVSVHMRNEDDHIFEALEEVHRIARESGAHLHISHLKVSHKPQWGKANEALAAIDAMQKDSFVTADQYPFTAFSTGIKSLLPTWAKKGSYDEITARFDDEDCWLKIKEHFEYAVEQVGGPGHIYCAGSNDSWKEIEGKNFAEIAQMLHTTPAEAYRAIMKRCHSNVPGITHAMAKEDVLTIMKREDIAVISDSGSKDFVTGEHTGKPHPRSTSSEAKFLRLVREEKLMPIEKAIAKMTSVPADLLGLKKRGYLKEGYFADIVIFDPETVGERATYGDPFRTAVGIDRVLVNGMTAWYAGKPVKLAGQLAERSC